MPPALIAAPENCTVSGDPSYAVAVKNVAQIQLTVNLARRFNLRLAVKNTGHDFSAKSIGMGALSIWIHNLKSVEFFKSYKYGSYSGPDFKVGAGIQVFEIYAAAKANGVTVVGGEGRTVGVAGGYILGGGHSPLSSIYGMAVDQVLSMEVGTADGCFVTASATSNSDLIWALSGGGGSTFGVVTPMVLKAHRKIKVTTMTYVLQTADGYSSAVFWQALRIFLTASSSTRTLATTNTSASLLSDQMHNTPIWVLGLLQEYPKQSFRPSLRLCLLNRLPLASSSSQSTQNTRTSTTHGMHLSLPSHGDPTPNSSTVILSPETAGITVGQDNFVGL